MPDPREPDMGDWPIGRLLSTAARLVEHEWHATLAEEGLTHAGLVVLHLLQGGPLAQGDIARRARVEVQTMSRTIDRLEREGHVQRTQDASDRRRQLVSITDAGASAWTHARTLEDRAMPRVSDPEAFRAHLLEIVSSLSERRWA